MALLVLKFGGTSVADISAIENAAQKVIAEVKNGHKVAVVVSAMSGVTNKLISYCSEIKDAFDKKEYDSVVSSGEQVTSGLMALALQKHGFSARSWMGWQIPIVTKGNNGKARIKTINADNLKKNIEDGEIAVISGFQGINEDGRITTLGRGGSDTSAVAIAAALNADRCDIYTDVNGVFTADPRIVNSANKIDKISYEEMLELSSVGVKVLQTRSIELAMKFKIPVQVLSTFEDRLGSDLLGTLVTYEGDIVEKEMVSGVTYVADEAKIILRGLPDVPGVAAKVFTPLSEAEVNVDMIIQNLSADKKKTDLTFTILREDLLKTEEILEDICKEFGGISFESSADVAKISVVGIGMRSHAGVAQKMFETLSEKGINIQVITTSEIKISVLISDDYTELALRSLHTAYGLDKED